MIRPFQINIDEFPVIKPNYPDYFFAEKDDNSVVYHLNDEKSLPNQYEEELPLDLKNISINHF